MVILVFFNILQLPHTVISNSEKLTHPSGYATTKKKSQIRPCQGAQDGHGSRSALSCMRIRNTVQAPVLTQSNHRVSISQSLLNCRGYGQSTAGELALEQTAGQPHYGAAGQPGHGSLQEIMKFYTRTGTLGITQSVFFNNFSKN